MEIALAAASAFFFALGTVLEGFLRVPLIGRLLVPSVPSSNGARADAGKAKRA